MNERIQATLEQQANTEKGVLYMAMERQARRNGSWVFPRGNRSRMVNSRCMKKSFKGMIMWRSVKRSRKPRSATSRERIIGGSKLLRSGSGRILAAPATDGDGD